MFVKVAQVMQLMARNLIKAGHQVAVFNRSQGAVEKLVSEGATRGSSLKDIGATCDFVFTCLPTPQAVEEVLAGPGGVLEGAKAGSILIDHSTVGVDTCQRMAAAAQARGASFLDAPVSGGPWGAEAASLSIMVGGEAGAFARALPFMQAMGKNIWHVGPTGNGTVVKLCNQLLVGIDAAATAEAMVLGTRAGVDPELLYEIISKSTGHSSTMARNVPGFIFKRNFDPGFSVNLLQKDVALANNLGRELAVRMLLGGVTQQVLSEVRATGLGEKDFSATIIPLEKQAGVEVSSNK
ncbi:MAG: NAD(P)-dependent oxidoreductase [Firmicutes bacterium]|nr:NAD(P)-dependent oxidoreductase [Bacillota bacterium]